jgi:hypothetical protein
MIPGFTANASLSGAIRGGGGGADAADVVTPQLSVCTPCVGLPSGRQCFTIPVLNRRICVTIPSVGRWHACCRTTWTPPFVRCGVSRC